MSTVVLIRPGCTDFDLQSRIQGTLDLPLNERGREEVRAVVDYLANIPMDVVYTAPCEPCRSTAKAIGEELGIPVKEADQLHNLNQGLWQGLQVDEIRRKYPKVFKQWKESPESICPPEGETVAEATDRLRKALQKPLKKKQAIGIVAPDPLASLIGCVLKGCRLEASPDVDGDRANLVEVFEVNGACGGATDSTAGLKRPSLANGHDAKNARTNGHDAAANRVRGGASS